MVRAARLATVGPSTSLRRHAHVARAGEIWITQLFTVLVLVGGAPGSDIVALVEYCYGARTSDIEAPCATS